MTWVCSCGEVVDDPYEPNYSCPRCGSKSWSRG